MGEQPFNLRHEIVGLLMVENKGQLSELLLQHAAECLAKGLPLDKQLWQPCEPRALDVARAAAQLFGVDENEALEIAREEIKHHPRRDIGVELIEFYLGEETEPATAPPSDATTRKLAQARGKSN